MTDYVLSCESTIDLSVEYVNTLDVSVINANFEINGESYLDDFFQTMDMKTFYGNMRDGAAPTTSRINTGSYVDYLRPLIDQGFDVIHVCLSTGLSSQFESLLEAIDILKEEYPERKIYPVDSLMGCSGIGILVSKMDQLKKEGFSIEELYNWTEENKLHVINYTSNENLEYVARGGRVSKTAASIGGMLHISPVIEVDNQGHLQVTGKIRTRKKLLKTLVDSMEVNAIGGAAYDDQIFIAQADNIELANELREMIEERFPKAHDNIEIFPVGPTIGSHIGPGAIGLFYWGNERMIFNKK